jgi:hypothetical protein
MYSITSAPGTSAGHWALLWLSWKMWWNAPSLSKQHRSAAFFFFAISCASSCDSSPAAHVPYLTAQGLRRLFSIVLRNSSFSLLNRCSSRSLSPSSTVSLATDAMSDSRSSCLVSPESSVFSVAATAAARAAAALSRFSVGVSAQSAGRDQDADSTRPTQSAQSAQLSWHKTSQHTDGWPTREGLFNWTHRVERWTPCRS